MNAKENKDELRAGRFLQTLGFEEVVYEPLGNVTPDFLLDQKIAVEVRRLNRNYINSENIINIENLEVPIVKNIKKVIESFKYNPSSHSSYVTLTLIEPFTMQNTVGILKRVKRVLKKHTHKISKTLTYKISGILELTFTPTEKMKKLYLYSSCDGDSLWIVHQLQKNIQKVVDEKNSKIEKNYTLYNEWWLLLVDSIFYSLDGEDFQRLKHIIIEKHRFSKVIILSPKGDFKAFEL